MELLQKSVILRKFIKTHPRRTAKISHLSDKKKNSGSNYYKSQTLIEFKLQQNSSSVEF